ncbi:MAG: hypothetical protein CVU16_08340 [Betaproteobacteria bacterium HGW-Betaproteobacteria-10]|nr:MAG: hypothetical protein CVU16_08340 [Betaproteobacteria bacterium HGW-Betaproteobacteria-10]
MSLSNHRFLAEIALRQAQGERVCCYGHFYKSLFVVPAKAGIQLNQGTGFRTKKLPKKRVPASTLFQWLNQPAKQRLKIYAVRLEPFELAQDRLVERQFSYFQGLRQAQPERF